MKFSKSNFKSTFIIKLGILQVIWILKWAKFSYQLSGKFIHKSSEI